MLSVPWLCGCTKDHHVLKILCLSSVTLEIWNKTPFHPQKKKDSDCSCSTNLPAPKRSRARFRPRRRAKLLQHVARPASETLLQHGEITPQKDEGWALWFLIRLPCHPACSCNTSASNRTSPYPLKAWSITHKPSTVGIALHFSYVQGLQRKCLTWILFHAKAMSGNRIALLPPSTILIVHQDSVWWLHGESSFDWYVIDHA